MAPGFWRGFWAGFCAGFCRVLGRVLRRVQGRVLGGVILGTRDFIRGTVEPYMKHTGGSLSPFNAWTLLKGLETISLRVNAQAETALQIATALQGHPKLARTIYPGLADHAQNAEL